MLKFVRDCLEAVNPFARHPTLAKARLAARLGAVALIGTALQSVVSTVFLRANADEIKSLLMRAEGPVSLEKAAANEVLYSQISPVLVMLFWGVTVLTVGVCVLLAWVQWHKLTKIIPLLYLGLSVLGLVVAIKTSMDPNLRVLALDSASSGQALMALLLAVLMVSAYRGASQYHALQGDRT